MISIAQTVPLEVLEIIFQYLTSLEDRKSAGSSCSQWYQAYCKAATHKKSTWVKFKCERDFTNFQQLNSQYLKYFNFSFEKVDITRASLPFWAAHGENIRSLIFTECYVGEKVLAEALSCCTNLEKLAVRDCKDLLMSGIFLDALKTHPILRNSFRRLRKLDFSDNRYLSDAVLYTMILMCPLVRSLNLTGCQISYHNGMYKKFYPHNTQPPSESVTTFQTILRTIEINGNLIDNLTLSNTLLDNNSLLNLVLCENIKLKELHLRECRQISDQGIIQMCQTDNVKHLTHLDLAGCDRITDSALNEISSSIPHLKKLSIQGCVNITDDGIASTAALQHLTSVHMGGVEALNGSGLLKSLGGKVNSKIEEMTLSQLGNMSQETLIRILALLPELRFLDLRSSINAVTDPAFQAIIRCNTKLQILNLSFCNNLTDGGLTGMFVNDAIPKDAPPLRIHLGSRQELDIRLDAEIKEQVKEMCENRSKKETGLRLSLLKDLRQLILTGCTRISDVSLEHAFSLQQLQVLDITSCQQITEAGLRHLVVNCPCIERLELVKCHNVNNEAVKVICKLPRLKKLRIGSDNVTDEVIYGLDGATLLELDLENCGKISGSTMNQLRHVIPTLRSLKYRVVLETENEITAPPKPPPSRLWKWCKR